MANIYRNRAKFLIYLIIKILLTILVLSAIAISTPFGQTKIIGYLSKIIGNDLEYNINVSNLDISLSKINLGKLTITKKGQLLLDIDNLSISGISFRSLSRINIKEIEIEQIKIYNLLFHNKTKNNAKDNDKVISDDNNFLVILPNIYCENIIINKLFVDKKLSNLNNDLEIKLLGKMSFMQKNAKLNFSLSISLLNDIDINNLVFLNLDLTGNYAISDQILSLDKIKLNSNLMNVDGDLKIKLLEKSLSGVIYYNSNILHDILNQQCDISGKMTFTGTFSKLVIGHKGQISNSNLNDKKKFFDISDISWQGLLSLNKDNLLGSLTIKKDATKLVTNFSFNYPDLHFFSIEVISMNFHQKTSLKINMDNYLFSGKSGIDSKNIADLSNIFSWIYSGEIMINSFYSNNKKIQKVKMSGKLKNFRSLFGNIQSANFDIDIGDLYNLTFNKIDLSVKKFISNIINLESLELSGIRDDNKMRVSSNVNVRGPYAAKLSSSSELIFNNNNKLINVNITNIAGNLSGVNVKNDKKIDIIVDNKKNFIVAPFKFIFNNGVGSIDFNTFSFNDNLNVKIRLDKAPLNLVNFELSEVISNASLSGILELTGNKDKPNLHIDTKITNLLFSEKKSDYVIIMNGNFNSELMKLKLKLADNENIFVNSKLEIPINWRFDPFIFDIIADKKILGEIVANNTIYLLPMIPMPFGQKISGNMDGTVRLFGTLKNPTYFVNLKIRDGTYFYLDNNIKLRGINIDLNCNNGDKILVQNMRVMDHFSKNSLTGKGVIDLSKKFSFAFDFVSKRFHIISVPYLDGTVAGDLKIQGDLSHTNMSGNLELGPFEFTIHNDLSSNIPKLNVTKIIEIDDKQSLNNAKSEYDFFTDLRIKIKKLAFVRGIGVNSRLEGNLHINGDIQNPDIIGKLKLLNGTYQQFGKTLNIRRGELQFDGKVPPSPYIDFVGVATRGNVEIRVILSNSILKPKWTIESTPQMSQEDALSVLLFGKDTSNMSPIQGIQLASALGSLYTNSSFDIIGASRKILFVDDINIKYDDANKRDIISIGKQLSERIYLEHNFGVQDGASSTKIQLKLTSNLLLEGTNTDKNSNSIGLYWNKDY